MKVIKSEIETAHTNIEMKIFGMLWLLPVGWWIGTYSSQSRRLVPHGPFHFETSCYQVCSVFPQVKTNLIPAGRELWRGNIITPFAFEEGGKKCLMAKYEELLTELQQAKTYLHTDI